MQIDIEQWRGFFAKHVARESELVRGYIRFLELCAKKNLPPIFEERHLALLVGVPYEEMTFYFSNAPGRYRTFSIPKRRGGMRELNVPSQCLLVIQKWVLHNILYRMPMSEVAHGGVPGRSIFTNARLHLGANAVLRMDLKGFFDSVPLALGIKIFEASGYSPSLSRSLALLCFEKNKLPQGAATSSALANLAALELDKRLSGLAKKCGLTYTRYVDDLTFSGRFISPRLVEVIESIVEQCRFLVNPEKTRLMRGSSPKFVTGISVGGDRLRVPRAFMRETKNLAFQLVKRGVHNHFEATGIHDPLILERVQGRLAFWLQAEPESQSARHLFAEISKHRFNVTTEISLPKPKRVVPIANLQHGKDAEDSVT